MDDYSYDTGEELDSEFDTFIGEFSLAQGGEVNETVDFTKPLLRHSMRHVFPLFTFLHVIVGGVGIVGNCAILMVIGQRRLYKDPMFFLLGNIAFSDLIKSTFVLPMTLANLLIQNWLYGSFMCFFLPMMQFFPVHASMLTLLVIAGDRYRLIVKPYKARVPAGLCVIAVWVVAVCVVLPYAVYIKYIDLGAFLGDQFDGVGVCYINHERHIEEYIRAMFVVLYALPLALIGFLYVRISAELKVRESAPVNMQFLQGCSMGDYEVSRNSTWSRVGTTETRIELEAPSNDSAQDKTSYNEQSSQYPDEELDLLKEKRTQSYLIAMVVLFAICWCPLNILILVTYFVHENADNRSHYDITFLTFSWFGFLSTCVNPVLLASWKMSDTTKDRLRGYLRFTNRRRSTAIAAENQKYPKYVTPSEEPSATTQVSRDVN